jgi:plasmid segregation protein ParM
MTNANKPTATQSAGTDKFILAADFGFGQTKIAFGGRGTPYTELVRPSTAIAESRLSKTMNNGSASYHFGDSVPVDVNGARWAVWVDPAEYSRARINQVEEVSSTDPYMALFHAALRTCGVHIIDQLVVGLPVTLVGDTKLVQDLRGRFSGSHEILVDVSGVTRRVVVNNVAVLPQPMGAYFELFFKALNPANGITQAKLSQRNILVYDPGYFSFDFCTIRKTTPILEESGSSRCAMRQVINEAKRLIDARCASNVIVERVDAALREYSRSNCAEGITLEVEGREESVSSELGRAVTSVAGQAVDDMMSKLSAAAGLKVDRMSVDMLIGSGGGAQLFAEQIRKRYPKIDVLVLEQSELGNARGFFYFGRLLTQQQSAAA